MVLMDSTTNGSESLAQAAIVIAGVAVMTILGAYFFQYVLGYEPCQLCLEQRIPYYVTIPLALVVAAAAYAGAARWLVVAGLAVIAITMLIGVGLGVYHSGVEWKWWLGPSECSGPVGGFGPAGNLLQTIQNTRVIRCDEAPWRFLGLSLAGYNTLISMALAAIAIWGVKAAATDRTGL